MKETLSFKTIHRTSCMYEETDNDTLFLLNLFKKKKPYKNKTAFARSGRLPGELRSTEFRLSQMTKFYSSDPWTVHLSTTRFQMCQEYIL